MFENNNKPFWSLSFEEVTRLLDTHMENGLKTPEINKRFLLFGRNTIESEKKANKLKIFLSQLKSPLILILIVAGIVTLSISYFRDSAFIFFAVIINSILGYWQENKAERALAELKTYLKQRSRVIRDGRKKRLMRRK